MKNKIKVCFFMGALKIGGAENLILNILKHIDSNKFDPYLCVFSKEGELRVLFESLGIPIEEFKLRSKLYAIYEFFRFIKYLRTNRIQIIHVNLVGSFLFSMTGATIACVEKKILHWHNAYEKSRTKRFKTVKYGSLISTKIIAISNAVKSKNCQIYKISKHKVITIYSSLDINQWNPNAFESKRNTIGTIGKFTEQKGYDILLKAFKVALDHFTDLKLEIIGTGYLESDIKNLSSKLGINNSVCFLDSLIGQSFADRLNSWSIFVLASRWEGFGLVLIEAMALEKPVVATKVDAIPEVVEDGVTGILCQSDDHNEIAQGITSLLNDKEKAIEMGRLGRKRVEKYFTIGKMVNELERIYLGEEL